jgi:two-component system, NarL family, nitrate/nitrite response regulator NarL
VTGGMSRLDSEPLAVAGHRRLNYLETGLPPDEAALKSRVAAPLRLLLVTEARFLGEALASMLERNSPMTTVTCTTPAEMLGQRFAAQADAVLVDAANSEGTMTARRLREVVPHLPIIAYAVRETDEDVVLWAEAGVTGYLPNSIKLAQIVRLVSEIIDGEQICSGRAAAALFRRVAASGNLGTNGHNQFPLRSLTRRERQIAELVAAGLGDKQIARELNISLATTKTHVHNLLGKLTVKRRGEVIGALLESAGIPAPRSRTAIGSEPTISSSRLLAAVG